MNNIAEAYNKMHLTEKFDAKKAEKALKDIQKLHAQVKLIDRDKHILRRWEDVWYSTWSRWFTSREMEAMKLPLELK